MATTSYGSPYVSGSDLVAGWPAASLSVANAIDAAGYYVGRGINAQTASYTGVLTDAGKTVTMTVATSNTFTVPLNATVAYPTGTRINILNLGAGACTVTATGGVTISGTISALATNDLASIIKTGTNTWSYLAAPIPGLSLVTPTSVAGSGVTLSGGAVSFSAASTVSVNGCFTSTYDNYQIALSQVCAAGSIYVSMRLRASGTDNTASSYAFQRIDASSTTVSGALSTAQQAAYVAATSTTGGWYAINVYGPNLAAPTYLSSTGALVVASPTIRIFGGGHDVSSAFDGFTLITSSNVTGTLRVYGLRNS